MERLKNKKAVITGGNSGIGLATARAFVREGAKVLISGRNQVTLNQAVSDLGVEAVGVKADVSRNDGLDLIFDKARECFGTLDVVLVNAGIFKSASLSAITEEYFDEIVSVNFKGALFTAQKALPLLGAGGTMIFTTSMANKLGIPELSVYSATKAAVRSMVRTLAAELAPQGIRVNAVAPGPIETPVWDRIGVTKEQLEERTRSAVPMGRPGQPEEIAEALVFLASDESSYMTGSEIFVDGGRAQV
jgi:NAD(P)-dependent dehydrogenase (short-subunit alcohol dehydrogenase family)